MRGRNFYQLLWIGLCVAGSIAPTLAQNILTTSFSPASICPGTSIAVTFTSTGTFAAGNVFTAQLSDANGTFPTTPIAIGTAGAGNAISAVIPKSVAAGTGYLIRVISSNPVRSAVSLTALTVKAIPTLPITTPPTQPYCEGDVAPALVATPTTGGILNWYGTSATGGVASTSATRPSTNVIGNTVYYVSQTVNGCEGDRAAITVRVLDKPTAPIVSSVGYCLGQTATSLKATAASGASLSWYASASGGSASSIAPTPPTSATGTFSYYVSQTVSGCESPRAKLDVTISAVPAAPTVTNPAAYCEGATATALSASGQNLKWYSTSATGGTASSTPTQPSSSSVGTTNYYVSQTVNGCESARTAIVVTVKARPIAPTTSLAPSYCQSQTAVALTATASTSATLNWYGTSTTGGTPSTTPTIPSTSQAGTVNYYVSQTISGCESARIAIAVTIKPTPAGPTVSSPFIICQNRAVTALTAIASAGATLNWYGTSPTSGTASASAPTPTTAAIGSTTYYVSQSLNGCEGPRSALTVTVNAVPAAPTVTTPSAYCAGKTASPLSAIGQNLKWYGTNITGGTASSTPTVPSTSTSVVGSTPYYVSQTVNGCESDRAVITVQVKDTPDAPGVSAIDFCQGASAPALTVRLVSNATPNWYGTSASGGTASANAPTAANTAVGTTNYYVSQTLSGCESSRASLSVRVKPIPALPSVSPISLCNNQTASPLTANGQNLKWYDASDQLLGGTPTPNTGSIGSQTFKVSQTVDNCEGPKASISVTINSLPTAPGVASINYCQSQQDQPAQQVAPLTATGQNLKWYTSINNVLPGAPTPSITQAGVQSYQVSQTVNNCEGPKAVIQVTVSSIAAPTVAKSLYIYCINDQSTQLSATGDAGSKLQWVDPYGRLSNDAPTPPTLNTNINPDGDAYYVYQISSGGCYSARAAIRIIVNSPPTLALAAPTASVNLGIRAPLQLKFTGSGPYSYTISDGTTGVSRLSDTTIAVLPRGNTTYQVTAVSNACGIGLPGNPATASVAVRAPTITTSSLATSTLCAGTSLVVPFTTTGQFNSGNAFRIELASITDTTKKYAITETAGGSPAQGTLPAALPSGQYYIRIKADNPEIGITGSDSPTQLTVRSLPVAAITGSQTINEGVPVNLTFTFGGDGPWTAVFADSVRSYSIATTLSSYVQEVRPASTTTYRLTEVRNNCGTGTLSGTATITVSLLLGVDDNSLDPLVKTYPVPTTSTLTIDLDLPLAQNPAKIFLTDLQGRQVIQHTTRTRQNTLDLTSQPTGLYMLRIQVGDRQTLRKVLKQ